MKFILALLMLISVAHAQQVSRDDFARFTDEQKVSFLNNFATEKPASAREQVSALFKRLATKAIGISDIWHDTILEGPYALTGEAGIEFSTVYSYNKQIYAYLFNISAPAIFTEGVGCEYNYDTEEWSVECMEFAGSISQSVLYDFSGREIDDGSYAEFFD